MTTAVDHVQPAAPPGSEARLRTYRAGVLGMTEVPSRRPSPHAAAAGSGPDPYSSTRGSNWTSGPRGRPTPA
ncbi:hypothetical protein SGRIM128S_04506 [Streptomyces griseomycini]